MVDNLSNGDTSFDINKVIRGIQEGTAAFKGRNGKPETIKQDIEITIETNAPEAEKEIDKVSEALDKSIEKAKEFVQILNAKSGPGRLVKGWYGELDAVKEKILDVTKGIDGSGESISKMSKDAKRSMVILGMSYKALGGNLSDISGQFESMWNMAKKDVKLQFTFDNMKEAFAQIEQIRNLTSQGIDVGKVNKLGQHVSPPPVKPKKGDGPIFDQEYLNSDAIKKRVDDIVNNLRGEISRINEIVYSGRGEFQIKITPAKEFASQYGELETYLDAMKMKIEETYTDIFDFMDKMSSKKPRLSILDIEDNSTKAIGNAVSEITAARQEGANRMRRILTSGNDEHAQYPRPIHHDESTSKKAKKNASLAEELGDGYSDDEISAINSFLTSAQKKLGDAYKKEEALSKALERLKLIRDKNEEALREIYKTNRKDDWKNADAILLTKLTGVDLSKGMTQPKIDMAMEAVKTLPPPPVPSPTPVPTPAPAPAPAQTSAPTQTGSPASAVREATQELEEYEEETEEATQATIKMTKELRAEIEDFARKLAKNLMMSGSSVKLLSKQIRNMFQIMAGGDDISIDDLVEVLQYDDSHIRQLGLDAEEAINIRGSIKKNEIYNSPEFKNNFRPEQLRRIKGIIGIDRFTSDRRRGVNISTVMQGLYDSGVLTSFDPSQEFSDSAVLEKVADIIELYKTNSKHYLLNYIGQDSEFYEEGLESIRQFFEMKFPNIQLQRRVHHEWTDEELAELYGDDEPSSTTQRNNQATQATTESTEAIEEQTAAEEEARKKEEERVHTLQQLSDQLDAYEKKSRELTSELSELGPYMTPPHDKDRDFYEERIQTIQRIIDAYKDLRDQASGMDIPDTATALTSRRDTLVKSSENMLMPLGMALGDTKGVYDSIDFDAREIEQRIQSLQAELIQKMVSNPNYKTLGNDAGTWIEEYKNKITKDTTSIDSIYAEFEQKLAEHVLKIEEENQKLEATKNNKGQFLTFLNEKFGADSSQALVKYADLFNNITHEANTLDEAIRLVTEDINQMNAATSNAPEPPTTGTDAEPPQSAPEPAPAPSPAPAPEPEPEPASENPVVLTEEEINEKLEQLRDERETILNDLHRFQGIKEASEDIEANAPGDDYKNRAKWMMDRFNSLKGISGQNARGKRQAYVSEFYRIKDDVLSDEDKGKVGDIRYRGPNNESLVPGSKQAIQKYNTQPDIIATLEQRAQELSDQIDSYEQKLQEAVDRAKAAEANANNNLNNPDNGPTTPADAEPESTTATPSPDSNPVVAQAEAENESLEEKNKRLKKLINERKNTVQYLNYYKGIEDARADLAQNAPADDKKTRLDYAIEKLNEASGKNGTRGLQAAYLEEIEKLRGELGDTSPFDVQNSKHKSIIQDLRNIITNYEKQPNIIDELTKKRDQLNELIQKLKDEINKAQQAAEKPEQNPPQTPSNPAPAPEPASAPAPEPEQEPENPPTGETTYTNTVNDVAENNERMDEELTKAEERYRKYQELLKAYYATDDKDLAKERLAYDLAKRQDAKNGGQFSLPDLRAIARYPNIQIPSPSEMNKAELATAIANRVEANYMKTPFAPPTISDEEIQNAGDIAVKYEELRQKIIYANEEMVRLRKQLSTMAEGTVLQKEASIFDSLITVLTEKIPEAITEKNLAFEDEVEVVKEVVSKEQEELLKLQESVAGVIDSIALDNVNFQGLSEIARVLESLVNLLKSSNLDEFIGSIDTIVASLRGLSEISASSGLINQLNDILGRSEEMRQLLDILSHGGDQVATAANAVGVTVNNTTPGGTTASPTNNILSPNNISSGTVTVPEQDWDGYKIHLEEIKSEIGDIIKITEDWREVTENFVDDKGNPLTDENGNIMFATRKVPVSRTFYGIRGTSTQSVRYAPTYDSLGNPTLRESNADIINTRKTPEDATYDLQRQTKQANLDRMRKDLEDAGLLTQEFDRDLKALQATLNEVTARHAKFTLYTPQEAPMIQKVKKAIADANEEYNKQMDIIRKLGKAVTDYNNKVAENIKNSEKTTDGDVAEAYEQVEIAAENAAEAIMHLQQAHEQGRVSAEQVASAYELLTSTETLEGSAKSRKDVRNAENEQAKKQAEKDRAEYEALYDVIQKVVDAQDEVNKTMTKGLKQGGDAVADVLEERIKELEAAQRELEQAGATAWKMFNEGKISNEDYVEFATAKDAREVREGTVDTRQDLNNAWYERYLKDIKELIDARTELNELETKEFAGEDVAEKKAKNAERLKVAIQNVDDAYLDMIDMLDSGDISQTRFDDFVDKLTDSSAFQGSSDSVEKLYKTYAKSIDDVIKARSDLNNIEASTGLDENEKIAQRQKAIDELNAALERSVQAYVRLDALVKEGRISQTKLDAFEERSNSVDYDIGDASSRDKLQAVINKQIKKQNKEAYDQEVEVIKRVTEAQANYYNTLAKHTKAGTRDTEKGARETAEAYEAVQKAVENAIASLEKLEKLRNEGKIDDKQLASAYKEYNKQGTAEKNARKSNKKAVDSKNTAEYEKQVGTINKLIEAWVNYNRVKAKAIKNGKDDTTPAQTSALNDYELALQNVTRATQALQDMYNNGLISEDQLMDFMAQFKNLSNNTKIAESEGEITNALDAQYNKADTAIKNYIRSIEKVNELQEKMSNGMNVGPSLVTAQKRMEEFRDKAQKAVDVFKTVAKVDASNDSDKRRSAELDSKIALHGDAFDTAMNYSSDFQKSGFETVERGYETLAKKAMNYYKIQQKLASGKPISANENLFLSKYGEYFEAASKGAEKFKQKLQDISTSVGDINKGQEKFETSRADSMQAILNTSSNDLENKILNNIGSQEGKTSAFMQEYDALVERFNKVQTRIGQIDWNGNAEEDFQKVIVELGEIEQKYNEINSSTSYQPYNEKQFATLDRQMVEWSSKNSAAVQANEQIKQLRQNMQSIESQEQLNDIAIQFDKIKTKAAEAGETGKSFADKLKNAFGNLSRYMMSFASFYRVIATLKQGIQIVRQMDTAMTDIKKVIDDTEASFKRFNLQTFEIADSVGTTAQSIAQAVAEWGRLGYSLQESAKLSQASAIYTNVGDIDAASATTDLVSALKAFNMTADDALHVTDILNEIGTLKMPIIKVAISVKSQNWLRPSKDMRGRHG